MKSNPSCERSDCPKEFPDNLNFCQQCGAALTAVPEETPAFDPYATIVATPSMGIAAPEAGREGGEEPSGHVVPEQVEAEVHQTVGSMPISPPEDVLEMPSDDPLKTMYVSNAELEEVLNESSGMANADAQSPEPAPPVFTEPEVPAPSFGAPAPPPSPFSSSIPEAPDADAFTESETIVQSAPITFSDPEPPMAAPPPPMFGEPPPPPVFNEPAGGHMQPQFGQQGGFQTPAAGPNKNQTLALVSLISGLVGLFFCAGLTGPVALVTGFMARKRASQNPNEYGGETLALIGIITGAIATLILLALIAYFAFVFLIVGAGILAG